MTTTRTRLSVIVCRLCGEKCYGQMDTGRWDVGHKRTCSMHPDYAPTMRQGGDHHFDPCPISGRCGICDVRGDVHPIGPIKVRSK